LSADRGQEKRKLFRFALQEGYACLQRFGVEAEGLGAIQAFSPEVKGTLALVGAPDTMEYRQMSPR